MKLSLQMLLQIYISTLLNFNIHMLYKYNLCIKYKTHFPPLNLLGPPLGCPVPRLLPPAPRPPNPEILKMC